MSTKMTLPVIEFENAQVCNQLCYLLTEVKGFSQLDLLKMYSNDTKHHFSFRIHNKKVVF